MHSPSKQSSTAASGVHPREMPARLGAVLLAAVLVAGTVSCVGNGSAPSSAPPTCAGGGCPTYRTAVQDFGFTGGFDPTFEAGTLAIGLYSQLLLRGLTTYRHVRGRDGLVPVLDLASGMRTSADGLTWTFRLKPGIRWGPPLGRPISSGDVAYAFRRMLLHPKGSLPAPFLAEFQGLVLGMDRTRRRLPSSVAGVETPDPRTVVFHLARPAPDFPYRLTLPAAAPVPPEVAGCFPYPGDYGRDLVSSGPFMIRAADAVDATFCRTLRPMAGFDPTRRLDLVPNPAYDPATDSPAVRSPAIGGVRIDVETDPDDIVEGVASGRLDGSIDPDLRLEPRTVSDRRLDGGRHWERGIALRHLSLNVLVPPFDDVHVRRAVALALNRAAVVNARSEGFGAPFAATSATHVLSPLLAPDGGRAFSTGPDLAAARAEMARSRYDRDRDGWCDRQACRDVRWGGWIPYDVDQSAITSGLSAVGIEPTSDEHSSPQVARRLVGLAVVTAFADFPEPSALARYLRSDAVACVGQANIAEVGMTPSRAEACGISPAYRRLRRPPPSLDGAIERCQALRGEDRSRCWAGFDREVTVDLAPWIPLYWPAATVLTARTVVGYQFDQASGMVSLAHLRMNPS